MQAKLMERREKGATTQGMEHTVRRTGEWKGYTDGGF